MVDEATVEAPQVKPARRTIAPQAPKFPITREATERRCESKFFHPGHPTDRRTHDALGGQDFQCQLSAGHEGTHRASVSGDPLDLEPENEQEQVGW